MGALLTPSSGGFTPVNDMVPIMREAGWVPGTVCLRMENLSPSGIQNTVLLARIMSLFRLNLACTHSCSITSEKRFPCKISGVISRIRDWFLVII
jgi:hypothetical protein